MPVAVATIGSFDVAVPPVNVAEVEAPRPYGFAAKLISTVQYAPVLRTYLSSNVGENEARASRSKIDDLAVRERVLQGPALTADLHHLRLQRAKRRGGEALDGDTDGAVLVLERRRQGAFGVDAARPLHRLLRSVRAERGDAVACGVPDGQRRVRGVLRRRVELQERLGH
jgi:hypothetical protein